MAPPPATPSPHRFLTKQTRPHHDPQPPPSRRSVQRAAATSSSSQFAPTPRFSLSSARPNWGQDDILPSSSPSASASPLVSRTRLGLGATLRRGEEIEDSEADEGMRHARERAERGEDGARQRDDDDDDARRRKRRRRCEPVESRDERDGAHRLTTRSQGAIYISSSSPRSPSPSSSSSPSSNSVPSPPLQTRLPAFPTHSPSTSTSTSAAPPTAPAVPNHPHAPLPRFLFPSPSTSTTSSITATTTHTTPPTFLRPPTSPSPDPLPELFSPHRRGSGGQKFVPGGLAATVRDWVVELGQSRPRRPRREREGDGDADGVRIRVRDVRGGDGGREGGVVLVRGMLVGGRGGGGGGGGEGTSAGGEGLRNWMLVGSGGRERERERERVEGGMVVLVRGPVWEVEVRGGERWGVGVEWRVAGDDGGG